MNIMNSLARLVRPARPRRLVVGWSATELTILDAAVTSSGLTVHGTARWNWPDDVPPTSPAAPEWLRARLAEQSWSGREALVVLPRQPAVLKLLEVPVVAPGELASLVQLQAESRLARDLSQLVCDFIPHPPHGAETQLALLAAYPRDVLTPIQDLLKAAGLRVAELTLAELALVSPSDRGDALTLGLLRRGAQYDVTLSHDGRPLVSQTCLVPACPDALPRQLLGGIDRLIAALPSGVPRAVGLVSACGEGVGELTTPLVEARGWALDTGVDVRSVPPFAQHLAHALLARSRPDAGIDLLNPRQPAPPGNPQRQRLVRLSLAGLAAATLVWLGVSHDARQLDAEIQRLRADVQHQKELNERGAVTLETTAWLREWHAGAQDWPPVLARFLDHLPAGQAAYLTRLSLESAAADRPALLGVRGQARRAADVTMLHEKLVADGARFQFQPRAIETRGADAQYPVHFEIEAVPLSPEPMPDAETENNDDDTVATDARQAARNGR